MTADFARLMDPELREHFVYRAYDATGDLLYVGCSSNVKKRLGEHKTAGHWHHLMTRLRQSGPFNYETARRLEREAIKTEDPRFNANTPANLAEKRRRRALFDDVFAAASRAGETFEDALHQASIAVDCEFPAAA